VEFALIVVAVLKGSFLVGGEDKPVALRVTY
jgi:hypothetical protein